MISTRRRPSTRHTHPKVVAEVYVGFVDHETRWTRNPLTNGTTRWWRWDVIFYETTRVDQLDVLGVPRSSPPMVGDGKAWAGRWSIGSQFGSCLTERGAWRRVRHAIRQHERWIG